MGPHACGFRRLQIARGCFGRDRQKGGSLPESSGLSVGVQDTVGREGVYFPFLALHRALPDLLSTHPPKIQGREARTWLRSFHLLP